MANSRTIIFAVAFACFTCIGDAFPREKDDVGMKLYWIFLTTGRSTDGVPTEDVRKMQKAHIANFGRLADEGKLLTAGPMRDPDGVLRGIVIVRATDRSAVNQMFDQDPYVTEGYMKVVPHEARIDHGGIVAKVKPETLEEFRIVILSDPKEVSDSKKEPPEGQAGYVANLSEVGTILLASTFVGKGGRRFVWIAKGQDNLKQLVDGSPAVSDGGLEYRIIPLYLAKGSLARGK